MTSQKIIKLIDIHSSSITAIEGKRLSIGIFFYYKQGEVVYVGQTKDGISRVLSHKDKDFDNYAFFPTSENNLKMIEKLNILHYKPILNKCIFSYTDKSINTINTICFYMYGKRNLKRIKKIILDNNIPIIHEGKVSIIQKQYLDFILAEFEKQL